MRGNRIVCECVNVLSESRKQREAASKIVTILRFPMVGGFKSASVTDRGVVYAADFATKTIAKNEEVDIKLDSVLKAQYQVVQGMNYKLYIQTLFTTENDEQFFMCVDATVYRDLKNNYKLSKWSEVECPEED